MHNFAYCCVNFSHVLQQTRWFHRIIMNIIKKDIMYFLENNIGTVEISVCSVTVIVKTHLTATNLSLTL